MIPHFQTLSDLPESLVGKRALVRFDWNVPLKNDGSVANNFRIRQSLNTLNILKNKGATIVAISHIGRGGESLSSVVSELEKLGVSAFLAGSVDSIDAESKTRESADRVVVFENLRQNKGEEENDQSFAETLSKLGDIYINEAFPVSHRAHASVEALPKLLPGFAGLQFEKEVTELSKAFVPKKPFVFVLGGAKFETKIPLLRRFQNADKIFLGGALLNDILRARGVSVGASLVSDNQSNDLLEIASWSNLITPRKVVVTSEKGDREIPIEEITDYEKIVDVAIDEIGRLFDGAEFVLWNGPLGLFEDGYSDATVEMAKAIAESGADSIVGGGDTVAAIENANLQNSFTFISTAGGAMLEFLANETLPGIEALKSR